MPDSSKVLLVEDDPSNANLLRILLGIEGYTPISLDQQQTIEDVLELVRRETPGLILLDVHLRGMNGFDLLHAIRGSDELDTTRILMLSGMDVGERCLQEGADGFILKPYMPDELIAQMKRVLVENTSG